MSYRRADKRKVFKLGVIAAIATPPGNGGIGIVRLSGTGAKHIMARIFLPRSEKFTNFRPWVLHRGVILDCHDEPLDDALVVYMPAPKTYTGEEMAEIHCHGGHLILEGVLESVLRLGARQAERGEFTRRAFLNGRMDLSQAEAVAEIISSPSREALRYGLRRLEGSLGKLVAGLTENLSQLRALACMDVDFPDDEVPGLSSGEFAARVESLVRDIDKLLSGVNRARMMHAGARVVLAGSVNAGKSSLMNAFAGRQRALVSNMAGTTRDFIEENFDLDGLPVCLVDTAGLRDADAKIDQIEMLGIKASHDLMETADLILLVLDGEKLGKCKSPQFGNEPQLGHILKKYAHRPILLVWNKSDIVPLPPETRTMENLPICAVSALTGEKIDDLASAIRSTLLGGIAPASENGIAPNARQAMILLEAKEELEQLHSDISSGQPRDCCLARLDTAAATLSRILEVAGHEELLDKIFSQFCIGK